MTKAGCQVFASHVLQSIHEGEAAIQDAIIHGYYLHPRSSREGFSITREKAEDWLREEGPLFSLVREWCGQGAISQFDELRQLGDEVTRLRVLVEKTAQWIRDSGSPVKVSFVLIELRLGASQYPQARSAESRFVTTLALDDVRAYDPRPGLPATEAAEAASKIS